MRCPVCEHDHDKVVDSRTAQGGNIIRRRRKCLNCGHKFTTYEAIEHTAFYVVKKDGRREAFQREKLLEGITTACKKRPVSMEAVERLVYTIETRLYAECEVEASSQAIGEMVMEGLKQLDEVAFVRFASVYRQFKDAKEFVEVLQKLKQESRKHTQRSRKKGRRPPKETLPLFQNSEKNDAQRSTDT